LKALNPWIPVIVISYRSAEVYVQHALAAGARACLLKDNLATDLIPGVAAAIDVAPATDTGASQYPSHRYSLAPGSSEE
jgi:DNA-binding NarL/FixJ family response regulator